jgi:hypothetical protein
MNALAVIRGISAMTLPAAFVTTAWWQRRRRRVLQDLGSLVDDPPERYRPQRAQVEEMIRNGEQLWMLDLSGMRLGAIDLEGRLLVDVDASGCRMRKANLAGASLVEVRLDFADLSRSDLRAAAMTETSLLETSFVGADLRGADLSRCHNLVMANLRKARFDRSTRWPPDFEPKVAGAIVDRPGHRGR